MFSRLQASLKKTREGTFKKLNRIFTAKRKIDDDLLDEIEEILIAGDVGVETTLDIIDKLKQRVRDEKYETSDELESLIRDEIKNILIVPAFQNEQGLQIVLVVGVNGTGKTTSIAKLAHKYKSEGKSVLLAAADTFRAAAIEQLSVWAERVNCEIIKHQDGADPSAVVFDAISAAQARSVDYLIIDTAGRLHTKSNLMAELNKIVRVINKRIPDAPDQVILVLDASTGQNAVNQAKEFQQVARVDSIFLSKLDGTAKGGVVLAINKELQIPVKYIGTGEKVDDMEEFDPGSFVEGLFVKE
ncbi:MAG: signal recognition particle-docking protein FtsY [Candidatus Pacebacteria bacterium]|nr:signal recognition particle-docking protein FtsY [Candidatus Paceibacterota bacterium]